MKYECSMQNKSQVKIKTSLIWRDFKKSRFVLFVYEV